MNDNWSEDCPQRGVGLHHAHWSDCDPSKVHPETDKQHTWTQCCHCERFIVGSPQKKDAGVPEAVDPPMQDHLYVATVVGLCLRCRLPSVKHPSIVKPEYGFNRQEATPKPTDPGGPCAVNHDSLTAKHNGETWSACPQCGTLVEARYPSIGAQGRPGTLGRGELSPTHKKRLTGWAGWVQFNGGS